MFTYAFVCVCVCVCVCASVSVSVCSPLNAHLKVEHTDTRTFKCVVFQGRRRLCRCRCVSGATASVSVSVCSRGDGAALGGVLQRDRGGQGPSVVFDHIDNYLTIII